MMTEPTKLYVPGMGMVPSSSTRRIRALSSRSLLAVDNSPESKPSTAAESNANDENLPAYNNTTTTAQNLGYGEEQSESSDLPTAMDLGYGDDTPSAIHIAPTRRRQPRAVGAVQIRNGKRISPMLGPYAGGTSSCASSICSYSTDDYDDDDDSSVDYSDDDEDDQVDEYELDMTELTVDMGEDLNQHTHNPHMPSQVNMEFEGDSTCPRRISLAFNQHTQHDDGRSTTRTGCLEVSIGTSRLPRRRANTMDHSHSQESGEIVRGLKKNHSNLSVSTRPMKRVSMEHTSFPSSTVVPAATTRSGGGATEQTTTTATTTTARITRPVTRRITMNLCSRAPSFSRRLSGISSGGGGTEVSSDRRLPPNRTLSGYSTGSGSRRGQMRPSSSFRRAGRRPSSTKNMECYSSPTVPLSSHATRRISMDMSPASPTPRDGTTDSRRRISMNLTKSILPREKPDPTITTTPPPKPIRRSTCCHARSA